MMKTERKEMDLTYEFFNKQLLQIIEDSRESLLIHIYEGTAGTKAFTPEESLVWIKTVARFIRPILLIDIIAPLTNTAISFKKPLNNPFIPLLADKSKNLKEMAFDTMPISIIAAYVRAFLEDQNKKENAFTFLSSNTERVLQAISRSKSISQKRALAFIYIQSIPFLITALGAASPERYKGGTKRLLGAALSVLRIIEAVEIYDAESFSKEGIQNLKALVQNLIEKRNKAVFFYLSNQPRYKKMEADIAEMNETIKAIRAKYPKNSNTAQ